MEVTKKAATAINPLVNTAVPVVFIIIPLVYEAGNPAVSPMETRSFPSPPHGGFGFVNFPGLNINLSKPPESQAPASLQAV